MGLDELKLRQLFSKETTDLVVYDSIDSTNTEARRRLKDGTLKTETLFTADHQTAGRGRTGHSFYSPADTGVYWSLAWKAEEDLKPERVTIAAAAASVEAVRTVTDKEIRIKWVNDLYDGHHKVAGILAERVMDRDGQPWIVLGIGINCVKQEFPEEIAATAGSLEISREQREELIYNLWVKMEEYLHHKPWEEVIGTYRAMSLVCGKTIHYRENGQIREGLAEDIENDGSLRINCEGEILHVSCGEISILDWTGSGHSEI